MSYLLLLICKSIHRFVVIVFLEELCQSGALDSLELLSLPLCH